MTKEEIEDTIKQKVKINSRLQLKKSEKTMYEKNKKGIDEIIDTSITSSYEERHVSKNTISDQTSSVAISRVEKSKECDKLIEQVEAEISILEYKLKEIEDKLKGLSYKELVVLEAKILNPDFDLDEIGRVSYYKEFGETRSDDTIKRILDRAYKKLKSI